MDSFKNYLNEKRFGGDTNIPASKDIMKYIEGGKGIIVDVQSTLHPTSRFAIYKNPTKGSGQDKVLMATISDPKRGKIKMFSFHGTHVSHQKAMDFAAKHKLIDTKMHAKYESAENPEYDPELGEMNIGEGFASDAQRRAAFASGYKAKGKKGKKEDVELDELGTFHADTHKIKKTRDGYQLFIYNPSMGKFVEQGKPQKTERAAEKYAKRFEEVELEEKRDMTKVVGRKVPELSSDARDVLAHAINMSAKGVPGMDAPLATGRNAGKFNDGVIIGALTYLRKNSSKMTPSGKKYAKEVIKVLGESVEIDEAKSPVKSLGKEAKAVLAMALNMSAKGSGAVAHDNNLEYFTPDAIDAAIKFLDKNSKKLTPAGRHAAREIVKTMKESVELEEKVVKGETAPFVVKQRDGNYITTTQGKKIKYVGRELSKAKRFTKKDAEYFASRDRGSQVIELDESVEPIEEMSAKKHYEKMIQQDKLGGKRVSPIDRKRFPNREREGLEGPYRTKRSGLIYYYDKKAGKYYDPQSDMYLDVKDVMEQSVDMSAVRNFLDKRK